MRRPVAHVARLAVAALALAAAAVGHPVAASSGASLSIEPANVQVGRGSSFQVQLVTDAPTLTSGVQFSVDFDPGVLQITAVTPGPAYADAPVLLPSDVTADIKAANQSGHLGRVAAALYPPSAVPAGKAYAFVLRFRAAGCGETDLRLPTGGAFNAQVISGETAVYGTEVRVDSTSSAHVVTCVGADQVTSGVAVQDTNGSSPSGGGLPLTLLGAACVVALGLIAIAVWQASRRRARAGRSQLDEYVD